MSAYIDYPNPVLSIERDDYNENCAYDVSFNEEEITVDENNILISYRLWKYCINQIL